MIFIKLDEFDLLDFFESEPNVIGEYEGGEWLYAISQENFEMIMLVSVYGKYIDLSITYRDNIVYKQNIRDVVEIRAYENMLKIITQADKTYYLKKKVQLGICVE